MMTLVLQLAILSHVELDQLPPASTDQLSPTQIIQNERKPMDFALKVMIFILTWFCETSVLKLRVVMVREVCTNGQISTATQAITLCQNLKFKLWRD